MLGDGNIELAYPLRDDAYALGTGGTIAKPVITDKPTCTGTFTADFNDNANLNRVVNNTIADIVLKFEGTTIATTYKYMFELTVPDCVFTTQRPTVSGPGPVQQTITFTAALEHGGRAGHQVPVHGRDDLAWRSRRRSTSRGCANSGATSSTRQRSRQASCAASSRRSPRDVAAEAAPLAPRRTGALAASYKPFVTQRGAGVRSRLPYAPVIEYGGTIRPRGVPIEIARSQPVTRAVLRQQDRAVERAGDAVDRAARDSGWH